MAGIENMRAITSEVEGALDYRDAMPSPVPALRKARPSVNS
jgi:hypothetical protein